MTQRRVRLKDIAEAYGCSINTVSKALRNSPTLPLSTRENIQKLAKEMGYIQNKQASSLRSGYTNTIAVIVNDIRNIYFANLINEIEISLRHLGYDLMIFCTQTSIKEEERSLEIIHTALSQSVDGILYFPYLNDLYAVEYLQQSNIPFVLVDHRVQGFEGEGIFCDNYDFGKIAAEYLLELGHTRFTYASGITNNSAELDRKRGFVETLSNHGVSQEDINIIPWKVIEKAKEDGNYINFIRPKDFPAIFAFNDDIAYRIIKSLKRYDILAPRDISIIGCDHLSNHLSYLDDLTSISWDDQYSLASEAVSLLCSRIRNPDAECTIQHLKGKLYYGSTTRKITSI